MFRSAPFFLHVESQIFCSAFWQEPGKSWEKAEKP